MPYLHSITHPNSFVTQKVNFFADYYFFVVSRITKSDLLDFENFLSIIEKILFQIETNSEKCTRYIDSYLSNPLLQQDNKYFKEFKCYLNISNLFEDYKIVKNKESDKLLWLKTNQKFILELKKFRTELKKYMFKNALKTIINFLVCKHEINEHYKDLFHYTKILITEYLFNKQENVDIKEFFSKIITNDIKKFPFPKSLTKNTKKSTKKLQQQFWEKKNFKHQFEGLYNLLKIPHVQDYFLFRVFNVSSFPEFKFKYNNVVFYDPNHVKFKDIIKLNKKQPFNKNFFDKENCIIAVVKIKYVSKNIGAQNALTAINNALFFLNYQLNSSAYIEKYSYLTTSDFINLGSRWESNEMGVRIDTFSMPHLNSNPYSTLSHIHSECKRYFLEYEPLFNIAFTSVSPVDYWCYLESLIPKKLNGSKQILDVVSEILLLDSISNEINILENHIFNCIANSRNSIDTLGLTWDTFMVYYSQLNKNSFDFSKFYLETSNLFIKFLIDSKNQIISTINYKFLKDYYKRILVEAQAQRNSVIHSNLDFEKSLLMLDSTLPNLVCRFRKLVIAEILINQNLTFLELLESLKAKSLTVSKIN